MNNSIKQHENLIQRHGNAFSLAETRQNTNRPATQPTKYPRNSCCISALECVSQRFTFVLAHFAMVISRYRYDLLVREFY